MKKPTADALKTIQKHPHFTKQAAEITIDIHSIEAENFKLMNLLREVALVIASDDLKKRKEIRQKVLNVTQG